MRINFWSARALVVLAVLTGLTGCSGLRKASNDMGEWTSDPVMPKMTAQVDLISLLSNGVRSTSVDGSMTFEKQFEIEIASFNGGDASSLRGRRNLIQDRIKVSADQLCDEYKNDIMRKQARANFWLGSTSLFLGSAGALSKGVNTARWLSGSAAFATGVRSEYNQTFFLDQTIAVIAKAIDKRQLELAGLMAAKRNKSVADYSIIQAIDDMSRYHASCSIAGALALTESAVQSYDVNVAVKKAIDAAEAFKTLSPVNPRPNN